MKKRERTSRSEGVRVRHKFEGVWVRGNGLQLLQLADELLQLGFLLRHIGRLEIRQQRGEGEGVLVQVLPICGRLSKGS